MLRSLKTHANMTEAALQAPLPVSFPHLTCRVSGCCVGVFTEDSGNPKLQNSPVPRSVDRETEELAITWGSSSIKIWLEAMGTFLKSEKGQNEKLQQELL